MVAAAQLETPTLRSREKDLEYGTKMRIVISGSFEGDLGAPCPPGEANVPERTSICYDQTEDVAVPGVRVLPQQEISDKNFLGFKRFQREEGYLRHVSRDPAVEYDLESDDDEFLSSSALTKVSELSLEQAIHKLEDASFDRMLEVICIPPPKPCTVTNSLALDQSRHVPDAAPFQTPKASSRAHVVSWWTHITCQHRVCAPQMLIICFPSRFHALATQPHIPRWIHVVAGYMWMQLTSIQA